MAEETEIRCESVEFEDGPTSGYTYCWEETVVQPLFDPDQVEMGLRQSVTSRARAWKTCQYFVKGMPAVCSYWVSSGEGEYTCSYVTANTEEGEPAVPDPSGFNEGNCDFLGRRIWCSGYSPSEEAAEWTCIAPNPYISGLGKRATTGDGLILRPVSRSEIYGFNELEEGSPGVGQCDCYGMGRGANGCALIGQLTPEEDADTVSNKQKEKALGELPVVCNYYRPYQMGFGAVKPQVVPLDIQQRARIDYTVADDPYLQDVRDGLYLDERLPLTFHIYGLRARFQKCQWYNKDSGSSFIIRDGIIMFAEEEEGISAFDDDGRLIYCTNPDSSPDPYRYLAEDGTVAFSAGLMSSNVIARCGCVVCNGAKPECPGYSGKWAFCTDEKMMGGMAVTAEQIMELRFWSADWEDQEQYTRYFLQNPNRSDPASSAIFTFDRWQNPAGITDHSDNRILGKAIDLCVPVPYHYRDFGLDAVLEGVLLKENVTYAPPYTEIGTNTDDQRTFPSLVRWPEFMDSSPLEVIHPYRNRDPFDPEFCVDYSDQNYVKKYYKLSGDSVSVIGYTVRNKRVYAINDSYALLLFNDDYYGVYEMPLDLRIEAYERIRNYVLQSRSSHIHDGKFVEGNSDAVGFFNLDPVKIDYNATNYIFIFVDLGDGTWEFRKRKVDSEWCGGIINQREFKHTYPSTTSENDPGYENSLPISFDPEATVKMEAVPMGGNYSAEMLSAFTREVPSILSTPYTMYDYHVRRVEKTVDYVSLDWVSIGNSNKIFVEISEINLNYIHEWDVISAKLIPKMQEDEFGFETEETIRPDAEEIELEKIDIEVSSLPPNACVLKPVENVRVRFVPSEWELEVEYYYNEFTNDEPSDEFPVVFGAGQSAFHRYVETPYSMEQDSDNPYGGPIISLTKGPVGLLANFKDFDGRIQSTFATKALTNVVSLRCRPLEIFYRYSATGKDFKLIPYTGFCTNADNDQATGEVVDIWEVPRCADHEFSPIKFQGPMWFPFSACQQFNLYDIFTGANFCTATYVGPSLETASTTDTNVPVISVGAYTSSLDGVQPLVYRRDYRYCGPYYYDTPMLENTRRGLAACSCGWGFRYYDASDSTVVFRGWSKLKGPVDKSWYALNGWAMPPYGNESCNLVEKFISQDYTTHLVKYAAETRSEWMPMVMDHSMFYFLFNAFDGQEVAHDYALGDNKGYAGLVYCNQMNLFTFDTLGETIVEDQRYRFDEIFEVRYEGNCSYPPPTIDKGGGLTTNTFYTFKDDTTVWAWPEYWREVDRGNNAFSFINIELIPYVFDLYKEEHRMTPEEGDYELKFIWDEEGTAYPGVQLGDGPIRYFKAVYGSPNDQGVYEYSTDNYGDEQVEWQDEGADGEIDGSSSENPYEQASTDTSWYHVDQGFEDRILFDSEYATSPSEAGNQGREMVTEYDSLGGGEIKMYYNRGILVDIKKSDLDYIPQDHKTGYFGILGTPIPGETLETSFVFEFGDDYPDQKIIASQERSEVAVRGFVGAGFTWGPTAGLTLSTYREEAAGFTFKALVINGFYGTFEDPRYNNSEYKVYRPGVSASKTVRNIYGSQVSTSVRGWPGSAENALDPADVGIEGELRRYQIYIEVPTGPIELVKHQAYNMVFTFDWPEDSFIAIESMELVYSEMETGAEPIKIWERKYITSSSTNLSTPNLDGTEDLLKYNFDLNNSGQYFRFRRTYQPNNEIQTFNKLRGAFCGPYYPTDESVPISYDTVKDVEKDEQKRQYLDSYTYDNQGDVTNYSFNIPPDLYGQLNYWSMPFYAAAGLTVIAEKLRWEDHYLTKRFKQYDFWRPGGHKYRWDQNVRIEKCTLFTSPEVVYDGYFEHIDHVGIGNPLSAPHEAVDPINSYYSLRFYTQVAKYDRFLLLSGGQTEAAGGDLVSAANIYNPGL